MEIKQTLRISFQDTLSIEGYYLGSVEVKGENDVFKVHHLLGKDGVDRTFGELAGLKGFENDVQPGRYVGITVIGSQKTGSGRRMLTFSIKRFRDTLEPGEDARLLEIAGYQKGYVIEDVDDDPFAE